MNEIERQQRIRAKVSSLDPGPALRGRSVYSTGFPTLDAALGIGGLPPGCIVEIFGPPSSGKTAFALQAIASCLRDGGNAGWIDAEHVFDPAFAVQLGVPTDRLPVTEPQAAEEAFGMARQFAASGVVDLIVIDSTAALVPRLEIAASIGAAGPGLHSRMLSSELRRVASAARRGGTCIVFLSQMRVQSGPGRSRETSSGGSSLKLHASMRIGLAAAGHRVRFRIVKNTLAAPFAECVLEWRAGSGFVELREDEA